MIKINYFTCNGKFDHILDAHPDIKNLNIKPFIASDFINATDFNFSSMIKTQSYLKLFNSSEIFDFRMRGISYYANFIYSQLFENECWNDSPNQRIISFEKNNSVILKNVKIFFSSIDAKTLNKISIDDNKLNQKYKLSF